MELLLNEKSLDGQFTSIEKFYNTLPIMSRNLEILQSCNILLLKHSSLYSRKITAELTIHDLNNQKGNVAPQYRDQIRKWKRELANLMMDPPFWDTECQSKEDSLLEAAKRETDVLSFYHLDYIDKILQIEISGSLKNVISMASTEYLVDVLWQKKWISIVQYLRCRYEKGRISFKYLEADAKSVQNLQKQELQELLDAASRFNEMKSWEDIRHDRFFDYKKYQPPSSKSDYFAETPYSDKNIDKFRCGQHSQVRCFGFREGEKFFVVELERDHSISNTG